MATRKIRSVGMRLALCLGAAFLLAQQPAARGEGEDGWSVVNAPPEEKAGTMGDAGGPYAGPPPVPDLFTDAAPPDPEPADTGVGALGSRYRYSSLRVISSGGERGCSYGDWDCMSGLCRADLGSGAWRGWAGCWKSGKAWQCYFDCFKRASVF